jgi:hypothetical protein
VAGWLTAAAGEAGWPLGESAIPFFATSDHESFRFGGPVHDIATGFAFNLVGGLLPQRSWFTSQTNAPVVTVCTCELEIGPGELGSMFALPTGSMHGPRDNLSAVDAQQLHHSYQALRAFLDRLETGRHSERLRSIDDKLDARGKGPAEG